MPSIAHAAAGFIKGFAIAAFTFAFLAALAFFIPRDAVHAHLISSEDEMESFRRADTHTECLVLGAALIKEENLFHALFDFKMFLAAPCEGLSAALKLPLQETAPATESYMRYWNGTAVLARLVFAAVDYLPAYALYLFLSAFALALWGYALFKSGVPALTAGLIPLALFWFGGFAFFGGNMAHGPAFFMPLLVLAICTLWIRWWEKTANLFALAAALGVVTLSYDMLFGAIPFMLMTMLVTALLCDKENNFHKTFSLALAFLGAGALYFVAKIFALTLLLGFDVVWADVTSQLHLRMGAQLDDGQAIGYVPLLLEQLPKAAEKMYGLSAVPLVLAGLSLLALIAAWRQLGTQLVPLLLIIPIVPLWYAFFINHSWVHSGFACRLLIWPILLGFLALALARDKPHVKL